jgi:hypothetical protein
MDIDREFYGDLPTTSRDHLMHCVDTIRQSLMSASLTFQSLVTPDHIHL